jgi:hypothetical protein
MREAANNAAVSDRIGTTAAREEGFYWVMLGNNPPEIAYWERGEWWLAGNARPWQAEAVSSRGWRRSRECWQA